MTDRRPALFRILVWLLWLLAGWGVVQYVTHAWTLTTHLFAGTHNDSARISPWQMLGWDGLYAVVAGLTLSAATGVLMWRDWARVLLRVLCVLLTIYFLLSAIMLYAHWQSFEHASADLLAQTRDPQLAQQMVARVRRATVVTLVLRALAIPLLAWLAWHLGKPGVRLQFQRKAG